MSGSKYDVHNLRGGAVQAESIDQVHLYTIYQQYLEAPSPLSDYIKCAEFQAMVEDRTKDFVGRNFVFEAIDGFLKDPKINSGYIVIRGEPGIGKTAIIAELVKQRAYVHHFNIASQNIRSPKDFLLNVCAQLILQYRLNYETLPSNASSDSGFLSRLLTEAAERADEQRVVVLVDAIDESEDISLPSEKSNRLLLPPALPKGVFFVISAREEHDLRLTVDQRKDIYLIDNDPQNLEDVVKYIRRILDNNAELISPRIEAWGVNQEKFIDIIKDKSEGNFMYLVHVLRDIRDGKLTSDTVNDINKLPQGLRDYYQTHWRAMRANKQDRFEKLHEPVVCTLAVVREPVTINQLMEWVKRIAGVSLTSLLIKKVINEWREFFNEQLTEDGEPRYLIYHTSFQDFLRDEVGLTRYHYNIAKTAFDKIPGFMGKIKH